jgi:hypothetical protein
MTFKNLFCAVLPIALSVTMQGCALRHNGHFAMSAEQAEANRRYTTLIELESQAFAQRERMNRAEAAEVATRHNPKSVSTTSVFAPRF